jgi:hypothetical protein
MHNSPLDQVMKLPVLVAHYFEHQQRDGDISIMKFLCMHYWGQDENDNDQDRDMQLPYKTVNTHSTFVSLVKVANLREDNTSTIVVVYPLLSSNDITDPALGALFRPPQA